MARLRSLIEGLRSLFDKSKADAGLDEELRTYLDAAVAEKIKHGMSLAEARRAARLETGSLDAVKEGVHSVGWEHILETFWQDLRFAVRMLRKSPGFTLIAVLTLALGIGANTAIFSMVDAVLLEPLPYPGIHRMVFINESLPNTRRMNDSWPDFLDWRAENRSFESMTAVQSQGLTMTGTREPRLLSGAYVSASFFPMLGARPILGRVFDASDDKPGAPPVAVLSYAFWRDILGSDRSAIGKTLWLEGRATLVIGVLRPDFRFPAARYEVYLPIGVRANEPQMAARENHPGIMVMATRRRGVSLDAARADMSTIMARLAPENPKTNPGEKAVLTPVLQELIGNAGGKLLLLLGAVGFVLLLACANVAHMTLARLAGRQREFALRAALGASWSRLTRQVLAEGLLLAGCGGVAGLLLARWTIQPFVHLYPYAVPGLARAHLDARVLAFALAVCAITAVLVGIAPVWHAARADVGSALKDSGFTGTENRSRRRFRSALFVAEIAAALVLSIAAGLTLRSLAAVLAVDPGFRADHLLALDIVRAGNGNAGAQNFAFFSQAIARIAHLPGVRSASAVMCPPFYGTEWTSPYVPADRAAPSLNEQPWTALNMVMPDYFQTMRTPLLEGRFLTAADDAASRPVAVVNETMARTIDARGNAVGKLIHVEYAAHPLLEVVGVVQDMKQWALEQPDMPEVYVPAAQMPVGFMTVVVRTSVDPGALEHPAALAIAGVDKNQPVSNVAPFADRIASGEGDRRFTATLLSLFGVLALFLAAIGVFGVMAYGVAQRVREFGIRMALGARSGQILWSVLGQGTRLALLGIAIGAGLAAWLAHLLVRQLLLFAVNPFDLLTFAVTAALLALVALLACYIPARRAMRVDPMVALRHE